MALTLEQQYVNVDMGVRCHLGPMRGFRAWHHGFLAFYTMATEYWGPPRAPGYGVVERIFRAAP